MSALFTLYYLGAALGQGGAKLGQGGCGRGHFGGVCDGVGGGFSGDFSGGCGNELGCGFGSESLGSAPYNKL